MRGLLIQLLLNSGLCARNSREDECFGYAEIGQVFPRLQGLRLDEWVVVKPTSNRKKVLVGKVACGHPEHADLVCIADDSKNHGCHDARRVERVDGSVMSVIKAEHKLHKLGKRKEQRSDWRPSTHQQILVKRAELPDKVYAAGKTLSNLQNFCRDQRWAARENLGRLEMIRFRFRLMVDSFPQMRKAKSLNIGSFARDLVRNLEMLGEAVMRAAMRHKHGKEWIDLHFKGLLHDLEKSADMLGREASGERLVEEVYMVHAVLPKLAQELKTLLTGAGEYRKLFQEHIAPTADDFAALIAHVSIVERAVYDELPRLARSAYGDMVVKADDIELTACYSENAQVKADVRAILMEARWLEVMLVKSQSKSFRGREPSRETRPDPRPRPVELEREKPLTLDDVRELSESTLVTIRNDMDKQIERKFMAMFEREQAAMQARSEHMRRRDKEEATARLRAEFDQRLQAFLQGDVSRLIEQKQQQTHGMLEAQTMRQIRDEAEKAKKYADELKEIAERSEIRMARLEEAAEKSERRMARLEEAAEKSERRMDRLEEAAEKSDRRTVQLEAEVASLKAELSAALRKMEQLSETYQQQALGVSVSVAVVSETTWVDNADAGYEAVWEEDQDYGSSSDSL